jgi:hypothetical protein
MFMLSELVLFEESQDSVISVPGTKCTYRWSGNRLIKTSNMDENRVSSNRAKLPTITQKEQPKMCSNHCGLFNCSSACLHPAKNFTVHRSNRFEATHACNKKYLCVWHAFHSQDRSHTNRFSDMKNVAVLVPPGMIQAINSFATHVEDDDMPATPRLSVS